MAGLADGEDDTDEGELKLQVTNSHTPETVDVAATKAWEDEDNADGSRPNYVEFELWRQVWNKTASEYSDWEKVSPEVKIRVTGTDAENSWSGTFAGLQKMANGKDIKRRDIPSFKPCAGRTVEKQ